MRPDRVYDTNVQHERTALAWERTAFAVMLVGVLATRTGAAVAPGLAAVGIVQVLFGAGLLVWAGHHYEDLHGPLRAGENPARPGATRLVGWATIATTVSALVLAGFTVF